MIDKKKVEMVHRIAAALRRKKLNQLNLADKKPKHLA